MNSDEAIRELVGALRGLVGDTGLHEHDCECDNTHARNGTVCLYCHARQVLQKYERYPKYGQRILHSDQGSDTKHWPGPWIDGKTSDSIIVKSCPLPRKLNTDTLEIWFQLLNQDVLQYYGGVPVAESVVAENKPLIKAAPDLLKVCKKAVNAMESSGNSYQFEFIVKELKEVISKAESEE